VARRDGGAVAGAAVIRMPTAERWPMYWTNARTRFCRRGRPQEQVDKVLNVQDHCPIRTHYYLDPRRLAAKYDHAAAGPMIGAVQDMAARQRDQTIKKLEARPAKLDYDSTGVMLINSRQPRAKPKAWWLSNRNNRDSQCFLCLRQVARQTDELFWPICRWLGWGFNLFRRQACGQGFCTNWPESADYDQ